MSNKLISPTEPFRSAYAVLNHEKLGFMVGAYLVETQPDGTFKLRFQRLLPENFERFAHKLDATDERLCKLLGDIVPQTLFKKFKRNESSLQVFTTRFAQNPNKEYIRDYIERRLAEALPLLKDRALFQMSRDGYPTGKRLTLHPEGATVLLHLRRGSAGLHYRAEVTLNGEQILLHDQEGGLLTNHPAWLWSGTQVFPLVNLKEGKRIKPFLNKREIFIEKAREAEYFEKFLVRVIADTEVVTEGIQIEELAKTPSLSLTLSRDNQNVVSLKPRVTYGDHELRLAPDQSHHVKLLQANGHFAFLKLRRATETEAKFAALLKEIASNGTLTDLYLPEAEAYRWLQSNQKALLDAGVEIDADFGEQYAFVEPVLQIDLQEQEDGYRLNARAKFGKTSVPLIKLRPKILKGEAKIKLPNKQTVFLPPDWLDTLRHLLEVARPEDDHLHVRPYHLPLLQYVLRETKVEGDFEAFRDFDSIAEEPLPQGLIATLRDYQKAGYDWLVFLNRYGLGGILADDMGLGKTLQAIALLLREVKTGRAKTPCLVVVPNSIVYNWLLELERFAPELTTIAYTGPRRTRLFEELEHHDIVITTYGTIRRDLTLLSTIQFHYIVLDESHAIKNREAKTTQAMFKLNSKHRLSLTGTPIENTTLDLWTQMNFLNPGFLGSAGFFERQYAIPIEKEQNDARAARLRNLTKPFLLRRTKNMVAKDLPERIEHVHYCEMEPEQAQLYKDTAKVYRTTFFQNSPHENPLVAKRMQVLSSIQRLRQIAIHPQMVEPDVLESGKLDQMRHLLSDALGNGGKVLIFSSFVKLLKILKTEMQQLGVRYAYLDGAMSSEDRAKQVDLFQTNPDIQVFLISLRAGGVGLNLTAAEYVFILDPWWNPAIEQQAINRAHRIGQEKTVFVYKFITRNSIEEKILRLQQHKARIAEEVIQSESSFFKSLTRDDLLALFE